MNRRAEGGGVEGNRHETDRLDQKSLPGVPSSPTVASPSVLYFNDAPIADRAILEMRDCRARLKPWIGNCLGDKRPSFPRS